MCSSVTVLDGAIRRFDCARVAAEGGVRGALGREDRFAIPPGGMPSGRGREIVDGVGPPPAAHH